MGLAKHHPIAVPEDDEDFSYRFLGYLEVQDDCIGEPYAFVVYTQESKKGKERKLCIRCNLLPGYVATHWELNLLANVMEIRKESEHLLGRPFKAPRRDRRRVEYRLLQRGGSPYSIQVLMVARNKDKTPKDAKILEVPWPFDPV